MSPLDFASTFSTLSTQILSVHPALLIFSVAGTRYLLVAAVFAALANRKVGIAAYPLQPQINRKQPLRECAYSLLSVLIFAGVNGGLLYSVGLIDFSKLYTNVSDYGWLWFWISIPIMLLAHDAQFYWLHRLIHTRALFSKVHRVHHLSKHPTAWAAYSFHPLEAIGEALIAISIIFVMPVHPLAFMLFQSISIIFNAYGHSGREFIPNSWQQHWLGRWFNTSTAHNQHHRSAKGNYGLYFQFWDKWMGTEMKRYPLMERRTAR